MSTPIVSICCITYNHCNYIRQCIDGFLMQKTKFPVEIIIHDDASTDGTKDVVKEYALKYPNIVKTILQEENQYSKGKNVLSIVFERAVGKYIAFCEGDDYWTDPFKLQKQVDFLENNIDCGLVYTDVNKLCNSTGDILYSCLTRGKSALLHSKSYENHLLRGGFIAPCTWLFRASLLKYVDPNQMPTDFSFAFSLDVWANSKLYFLNEVTSVYRIVGDSVSHTLDIKKRFDYLYGVYEIKCHYIDKYPGRISEESIVELKKKTYYELDKLALFVNRYDIIKESQPFMSHNIKSWILSRFYRCPLIKKYLKCALQKDGYTF